MMSTIRWRTSMVPLMTRSRIRTAIDHLLVTARERTRAMTQRRIGLRALCLEFAQMVDVAHADGKFGEMQHVLSTRVTPR